MSRRRFDWLTWIDEMRQDAEVRVRAWSQHPIDSEGWETDLVSDERYSRALDLWTRHQQAADSLQAAQEALRATEAEAREMEGQAANTETHP